MQGQVPSSNPPPRPGPPSARPSGPISGARPHLLQNREPPPTLPPPPPADPDLAAWGPDASTETTPPRPDLTEATPRPPVDQPSHRDDLVIQDYTLIKRIGSGAYGEVWLGQSITGALRAVKIVWREDFELTKTFHREFEGIQQFEPISRGHPCLVHILHVGWNEERGFYYYVMELADDAIHGAQINDLGSYLARTVSADMKRNGRLDLHFCREAGVYLADALAYMHDHGLTHRDIKPSNIIFVGDMCKLADIGLVAASGERTFVGTEGFVPPEGPGTPQADIYSLGKVLYEMSSGNDRMEFPEVPTNLKPDEWDLWLDLNRVICKACAPDLKERFANAHEMMSALQNVGQRAPEAGWRIWLRSSTWLLLLSLFTAGILVIARQQTEWSYQIPIPKAPLTDTAAQTDPPVIGRPWKSRFGNWFTFQKNRHVADVPLEYDSYTRYLDDTLLPFEGDVIGFTAPGDRQLNIVLISPQDADNFCAWATRFERETGHLDPLHEYAWTKANLKDLPIPAASREDLSAIRPHILPIPVGTVAITSTPPNAAVFRNTAGTEELLGYTPIQLTDVRSGTFDFSVRHPGFAHQQLSGQLAKGETLNLNVKLRPNGAVVFDKEWTNSLGMQFAPLNQFLMATTETTIQQFTQYLSATGTQFPSVETLSSPPTHPIHNVTRTEAQLFCRWLTERERALGLLEPDQLYRLPTDDEWSTAAYLPRERGSTPEEKNLRIEGIYPWGFSWPPPPNQANLAGSTEAPTQAETTIPQYRDGNAGLSPVGTYAKDNRGLTDLSGNVWEWVSDPWNDSPEQPLGVVRGGSYLTFERRELLAAYRRSLPHDSRQPDVGFRVLLAPAPPPSSQDQN